MDVGFKYRRADDGSNGQAVRELMSPQQPLPAMGTVSQERLCMTAQPRVSNFQDRYKLSREITAFRLGR